MKAIFHGVRGSIPTPLDNQQLTQKVETLVTGIFDDIVNQKIWSRGEIHAYLQGVEFSNLRTYGGNTPCIEVLSDSGDRLILDAGSGIRSLGLTLLKGVLGQGMGEAHILLSHFHHDHIQGLPFFVPLFIAGNRIHYYSGFPDALDIIKNQFGAPYFPVEFDMLASRQDATCLQPGQEYPINGFRVGIHPLNHPGGCFAWRIEADGQTLIYATDSEFLVQGDSEYAEYRSFFHDADCLIVDTQYSILEALTHKSGWGHSPYNIDIDLAVLAGIKRLVFFHYDPMMSDTEITRALQEAREYQNLLYRDSPLRLELSWEGRELKL
jgi:phosphoribosyl 1,2-cyclic phosphodiesterase